MNVPSPTLNPLDALKRAVAVAGGQASLARACGVKQPSVWAWLNKIGRMPGDYVLKAEAATGVSKHDLRPDLYPRDVAPVPSGGAALGGAGGSSTGSGAAHPDPLTGFAA